MSETDQKHTPGPWIARRQDACYWKINSEDWGGIASLHDPLAEQMERDDGLEANAHLIAAAPELLEALERIVSVIDKRFSVEYDLCIELSDDGHLNFAREKIAKAKGKI